MCVSVILFFLLLSNIPLFIYYHCFYITLLLVTWVVFSFCYYEHSCISLCGHIFLLGENIRMELLDCKVGVCLVL